LREIERSQVQELITHHWKVLRLFQELTQMDFKLPRENNFI